jgi:hypothetical protein
MAPAIVNESPRIIQIHASNPAQGEGKKVDQKWCRHFLYCPMYMKGKHGKLMIYPMRPYKALDAPAEIENSIPRREASKFPPIPLRKYIRAF